MPRQARTLMDGGYYHVVTRGIDRRRLFRYKQDYEYFLSIVNTYLDKFPVHIVHYCLMNNHLHFLVKIEDRFVLPKFMQAVLQVYARHFRDKYSSAGFIFQNRYKSKHISNDSYLIECGRYIERNPLRAKVTTDLFSYPWSSFLYYAKGTPDIIITPNPLYKDLATDDFQRRRIYAERVFEERPYEHIVDKEFRIK